MFFFFFQAEDGIRDATVTGVKTCALPIFDLLERVERGPLKRRVRLRHARADRTKAARAARGSPGHRRRSQAARCRSEERRVGKEWRYRGSPGCGKERIKIHRWREEVTER